MALEEPVEMCAREAINKLRALHIKEIELAAVAHESLRIAEENNWNDSWKYEGNFHAIWYKAAGIFAAIKELEQYT